MVEDGDPVAVAGPATPSRHVVTVYPVRVGQVPDGAVHESDARPLPAAPALATTLVGADGSPLTTAVAVEAGPAPMAFTAAIRKL